LVLTASCAAAFKVPAARPAIVWRATMVRTLTQDEKDRRDAVCREVLKFAAENEAVGSIKQCAVIVHGKTWLRINGAERALRDFKNALPEGHPLRAAYDAIVARATSAEGASARARVAQNRGQGKSIVDMREARVAYAARPLPTLEDSGERLRTELERAVPATAATPQKQLEGLEECACNEAFETAKSSFEERVGIVESVGATNVPEEGFCFISDELVKHTASLWDAEHAKNERAIVMEGVLQEHYESEMEKMAKPRRAASRRGRETAHGQRFESGTGALAAPVALTKAPGSFVSSDKGSNRSYDGLMADAVEAAQKIRVDSRVVCLPLRKSELYGRLRPTALSEGSDLCPIEQRPMPAQIQ